MRGYKLEVEIRPWEDGAYLVEVPAIQGCWCVIKSNRTVGKALDDIRDVVDMAISARKKQGRPVAKRLAGVASKSASLRLKLVS